MRTSTVILFLVLLLAFTGIAGAQSDRPQKEDPLQQKDPIQSPGVDKPLVEPLSAPEAEAANVVIKTIRGKVVSVDAVNNTIVIKYRKGEKTFTVDPAAKIMVASKKVKLADLQKNSKVTLTYKADGDKKIVIAIK